VNNYLANIAARTLNLTPLVRPRLPGQFELAPVQPEGGSNRAEFGRPPAMAAELRERLESTASVNTAPRRSSYRQVRKPFDVNDEPGVNGPVEARRPSGVSLARGSRAAWQSDQTAASTAEPDNRRVPNSHRSPILGEPRTTTIQPVSQDDEQLNNSRRLPVAHRLPSATALEPSPVGARETAGPDGSARRQENSPKLPPVATIAPSSGVFEETGSTNRLPIIVQSRLAPRLEGDRLAFRQQANLSPEPTVHVTIGRIEVRAVQSSKPSSSAKPRATPPVMNLDDYLRRRSNGGAR